MLQAERIQKPKIIERTNDKAKLKKVEEEVETVKREKSDELKQQ